MDSGETKIFYAILLAAGIIGFIILLFIIVLVWSRQRIAFLQHNQLEKDITALEHERKRIVSDLHDELGPLLSVVKIQVANLETTLKQDIEQIKKATDHLDDVLMRIRNICSELVPTVLARKGLFIAIDQLIEEFSSLVPIKIEFIYAPVRLEPSTEIHIYRMLHELITNAVKHSDATTLNIVITHQDHMLLITVTDDGKGFYPDKMFLESNGLGLKNILSRAHALKGNVFLDSEPAKGTFYNIEIPIQVISEKGDGRHF
jgi:two-component system, NarL family, sensor kinase